MACVRFREAVRQFVAVQESGVYEFIGQLMMLAGAGKQDNGQVSARFLLTGIGTPPGHRPKANRASRTFTTPARALAHPVWRYPFQCLSAAWAPWVQRWRRRGQSASGGIGIQDEPAAYGPRHRVDTDPPGARHGHAHRDQSFGLRDQCLRTRYRPGRTTRMTQRRHLRVQTSLADDLAQDRAIDSIAGTA